jgi:hypothetical protein
MYDKTSEKHEIFQPTVPEARSISKPCASGIEV